AGLPGYEVSTWYAMWAPKNTPPEVVEKMTAELKKALAAPMIAEAWKRNGSEIPDLYGAAFGTFVKSEVERWGKVVANANVKPD
uniref:tripartite tricarboxylate transporter substrate-binding protein n=1 Tax=Bosea sp. (in: a-proteobacteria) TaxID=1871050 RepID=UPI002FCB07D3